MRKIKEVLRLRFEQKLSYEQIACSVDVGCTTAREYVVRAQAVNISWPLPDEIDDTVLEQLLFHPHPEPCERTQPDLPYIHKELKRKGVTLLLLWGEYKKAHSDGYGYTHFTQLYNAWIGDFDVWMPQEHKAGESTFVDYAGLTVTIFDSQTQGSYEAQIFVSVLGASSYTYCEATKTQQLPDWIASHIRMFTFYGGVTEILIPDNLKSGVTTSNRYEPDLNPTYHEMARHYATAIVPARARKPKDKSKAENAVLHIERQILAPLRDQTFFHLDELNGALWRRLKEINTTPFQKMPGASRHSLYIELDRPHLKPLPDSPYQLSYWSKQIVKPSYHVPVSGSHYSVPYHLIKRSVEVRHNDRVVEIFYKGKQTALHPKHELPGTYITNPHHRPPGHQHQADCIPEKIREQALQIGTHVAAWIDRVLQEETLHSRQQIKICLGVVRLIKTYPAPRLEAACQRALYYENFSYKGIKSILESHLEERPLPQNNELLNSLPQDHDNIRGPEYFE